VAPAEDIVEECPPDCHIRQDLLWAEHHDQLPGGSDL
jgi:hypothetical protein